MTVQQIVRVEMAFGGSEGAETRREEPASPLDGRYHGLSPSARPSVSSTIALIGLRSLLREAHRKLHFREDWNVIPKEGTTKRASSSLPIETAKY